MKQGDPRGGLEIRVQGLLDSSWSEWFDGMTITTWKTGRRSSPAQLSIKPHCSASLPKGAVCPRWSP